MAYNEQARQRDEQERLKREQRRRDGDQQRAQERRDRWDNAWARANRPLSTKLNPKTWINNIVEVCRTSDSSNFEITMHYLHKVFYTGIVVFAVWITWGMLFGLPVPDWIRDMPADDVWIINE